MMLLLFLVSCSTTEKEPEAVGVSKNTDIIAQFAFEEKVYSVEGNMTPAEKIQNEVGKIEEVVDKIEVNGQVKQHNSTINIAPETKIYNIKGVDKDFEVAVKVGETYYTAIFAYHL